MLTIFENPELRQQLVAKIADIISSATALHPLPDEVAEEYANDWSEEYAQRQIPDLYRRASMLLGSHGFALEAQQLDEIYQHWQSNPVWRIQDGPEAGDYGSLHSLTDFLSRVKFVVDPEISRTMVGQPNQFNLLMHVLRHLEDTFSILKTYPDGELEFERIAESILICVFPKMKPNVSIDRQLKRFQPDTGIPEAKTLIDYKFVSKAGDVAKRVDEINADIVGFKKVGWDRFVFVIYEDQRHATLDQWQEHFKELPEVAIVLVKGSLNKADRDNEPPKSETK